MRRPATILLLLSLLMALARPGIAASIPPADPQGLTALTLDNQLNLWIHPTPPGPSSAGDIGLWLVIHAGALAESDTQIGAAYLAKRAAGLGTPNAPAESLDRLRTRFGRAARTMRIADGAHAFLSHEAVVYTLVLDPAQPDALATALAHYADLLGGWSPDDAALARARVMTAERTHARSPEERARRVFIPDLFAGQPLANREIIPDPARLASDDAVRDYIRAFYRPANATLIIAGPIDPGEAISTVRRAIRTPDTAPAPRPAPGITAPIAGRVSAFTIAEYESADISLVSVTPGPSVPPGESLRTAVLDAVATELIAPRIRTAAALGDASVVSADTAVKPWLNHARVSEISVRVDPEGLEPAGAAVGAELARIARDGFTDSELLAARAAALARFEQSAADWRSAEVATVLQTLGFEARLREPGASEAWVAPADMPAHAARILAATTNQDLDRHTRRLFAPDALACILISPDESAPPTPDQARAVLAAAQQSNPPAPSIAPIAMPGPDMPPGRVDQIAHDPVTAVWTATLSNGVLVRVRRTTGGDRALVRVTVADGTARETADTLGRTRDAVLAWRFPRTAHADAAQLRAWMLDRGLTFKPAVTDSLLVLEIDAASAAATSDALRLAAAVLADPGVDHAYTPRLTAHTPDFGPGLRRLGEAMLPPADPRARKAPDRRPDPAAADEWLRTLARAPLEVSIVTHLAPDEALRAAAATLGGLPRRDAPARNASAWPPLPRTESVERVRADAPPEALLGVVFADASDLESVRPMMIAAAALQTELERMRTAGELTAEPRAWVWLGDGIPGRATLVVRCERAADPARALEAVDAAIERLITGQTDPADLRREIDRARRSVERAWEQPAFWADRLSRLSVHGQDLGSVAGMHAAYASLTPESVREALAAAVGAGVHKRVIVTEE